MKGYNMHCVGCGNLNDVSTLSEMLCEECRGKLRDKQLPESTDPAIMLPTTLGGEDIAEKVTGRPRLVPDGARLANANELTVTVTGAVASGKTVLLTLLASFLHEAMTRHALGPNIRLAYKVTEEFRPIGDAIEALRVLTSDDGPGLSITLETVQLPKRH